MIVDKKEAIRILQKQTRSTGRISEELGTAEKNFNFLRNQSDMEKVKIEEKREIIAMRKSWSTWILRSIIAIIAFDFLIIILIGIKLLNFEGYIVPIFITESLIKVLGLAIIIVNFLFNKKDKNLL